MSARLLAAALLASWLAAASAAEPPAAPAPKPPPEAPVDPAAGVRKLKRGSAEEKAAFEKHQLPLKKKAKAVKKGKGVSSLGAAAPAAPAAPALPPAPALNPGEVLIEYELEADAEVLISLMAPDGAEVRRLPTAAGGAGGTKGLNRVAWDGLTDAGEAAAPGEYMAVLSINYHRKGEPPTPASLMFPVTRKAP